MKRVTLTGAAILLIFTMSCKENNQNQKNSDQEVQQVEESKEETSTSFSDNLAVELFDTYQEVRLALINSDAKEVQMAVGQFADEIPTDQPELKGMVLALAQENDVEKQRILFSDLTVKVEPMFREFLAEGEMYKQFCPMAFEGKGGYWISDVEEIRNPYFGDKMLTCGKVVEVIQ